MFPKLIAFETRQYPKLWSSGVLFLGSLREELWGKGSGASSKLADNVKKVDTWLSKDKSNHQNTVTLCPDIPRIIENALKNGASIALVSRHDSKLLVDRVLYYFHATDPRDNQQKSIIKMVRYNEIVNESKTKHFERIQGWSKYAYDDMV
ncbi:hypothetical protein EV702DRAFT_1181232 [Suillus placidus]|uniref:Uncharacterized protein n=1 Tax=Suillus placidus TaxID=48579 RepID=A0A9P6ZNU1_9AGAM|nr:hypothetical protein EV702DRAFT_1181232 [Suillus placidus]